MGIKSKTFQILTSCLGNCFPLLCCGELNLLIKQTSKLGKCLMEGRSRLILSHVDPFDVWQNISLAFFVFLFSNSLQKSLWYKDNVKKRPSIVYIYCLELKSLFWGILFWLLSKYFLRLFINLSNYSIKSNQMLSSISETFTLSVSPFDNFNGLLNV